MRGLTKKSQFDLVFPDKRCIYKAPSAQDSLCELEELSPQVTEGECANMKISKNMRFAGSFHHATFRFAEVGWSPSLPEGGFCEMKITVGTQ